MRDIEFCVIVTGWRHVLRSEWPFIIIIINHMHDIGQCIGSLGHTVQIGFP